MPPRILFTIPNFVTAGSGRAMLNVIEGLDRKAFEPSICVLKRGGVLEQVIERLGIPYFEASFSVSPRPLWNLPARAWRAARVFAGRFDLWHSFHYADDYTEPLIARLAGARAWVYTKKNMSWRRSWWVRTALADRVAAQNSHIIRNFFSARQQRRSRLIPPSVDYELYRPGVEPRLGLRARLGLEPRTVVLTSVAQLVPVKGHPVLLRAMAHLEGVHLLLAGKELDPAYAAHLREIAAGSGAAGRVHFLGGVSDVPALLAETDIFVLSSRMEACPVALLEAMACGVPAVVSDIPGTRDVVQPGSNGLSFPQEDPLALAEAVRQLIDSEPLRRRFAEAGREAMVAGYGIEREVRQYEALYRDALGIA